MGRRNAVIVIIIHNLNNDILTNQVGALRETDKQHQVQSYHTVYQPHNNLNGNLFGLDHQR